MSVKAILVLCAQALLLKSAIGQTCTSRAAVADVSGLAAPYGLAAPALAAPCGLAYDGLVNSGIGLAGRGLALDGLAAGYAGRGLALDGLAAGYAGRGLALDGLAAGYASRGLAFDGISAPAIEISPTSGGALPVSSASAIAPVGISILSDNAYEGILAVGGELPFVGTVAMEGVVPSAGAGAVNHACGNGRNAMISETAAFAPAGAIAPLGAYGPGSAIGSAALAAPGLGLRGGWAGRGCGCGI